MIWTQACWTAAGMTACGSKPMIFFFNSSPKPVITAMTTINAAMPITTPVTESTVMMETKLRFGFR